MCDCKDIEFGSYGNQIAVPYPPHMRKKGNGWAAIDRCLLPEILKLWWRGIETTGCCCGHNKQPAFIGVIDRDIPEMKRMGYEVQHNTMRPGDEDSFTAKSVAAPPPVVNAGEWVKPVMQEYEMTCCDCGLTHSIDFKIVRRIDEELVEDVDDPTLGVMLRAWRLEG